ncbi:MAG TPA: hypothetical protein PKA16_12975 [Ottowia sp.]|uniref:hypothetical protein n=1 Tax=Ottowia sp. TaxID=1898956 RepID=UPI002C92B900|nr:hypothetical protein [Ottowia sp.]HMN22290.1 hypothetical protein [Ottowia sp.]
MQPEASQGDAIALDDLFTIEELVAQYPKVLSINTMNWHLRHRDTNGLAAACVKGLRRKMLISKSRFERWLATQTEAGRAAA